jgi:DNA helicase TIP49 (TBP-interacting protein)
LTLSLDETWDRALRRSPNRLRFELNTDGAYVTMFTAAYALEPLPAPLLDRALVIRIDPPATEERKILAQSVVARFMVENGRRYQVGEEAMELLANNSPRTMSKLLLLARGFAAERRFDRIEVDDLTRAQDLIGRPGERRFGFL